MKKSYSKFKSTVCQFYEFLYKKYFPNVFAFLINQRNNDNKKEHAVSQVSRKKSNKV